ncbi:YihY/virulence factor BrkB family protein [Pontivivens nitratireducens]|uniref:YihY/virulence factor BrkB family protein n=1 Tax=Pontivivens nitratireducens TaxID=2758038 RepID=UPI00163B4856|nr:YihY/virulence factor BrkB family protein [Pontibrevibacter nitratireducens]
MNPRLTYGLRPLTRLTRRDWYLAMGRIIDGVGGRSLFLAAGGMAFFATLSIFPFLAFLIATYGYVSDPTIILIHINEMRDFLPPSAFDLIQGQLMSILSTERSDHGLRGLLSILFTLWFARAGSNALLEGLNLVFSDRERRTFLRHTATAIILTLTLIGIVIFALLALVAMPVLFAFVPLPGSTEILVQAVTYGIGLGAMTLAIGMLYHFGPNRRGERLPLFSFGAIVAAILWMSVSAMFSYYLGNFGNYNEIYGSIGAVAALMMWFFVTSFIVLFGALLNREIERAPRYWRPQTPVES